MNDDKFYKLYIEISGRGCGKTYRLRQNIIEFLAADPENKVNIISLTEMCARYIKEKIPKEWHNRIVVNKPILSSKEKK